MNLLLHSKIIDTFVLLVVPILFAFAYIATLTPSITASEQVTSYHACKCVIFRLDDVEDFGSNKVQSAILDYFISKDKKLVVGIILNKFANQGLDGLVYTKVKEGYDKGLFELAIHGWDHVKYSNLTEDQQVITFIDSNKKLQSLFGNKSRIFIPPFNSFNYDTVKAMAESGLEIFSTSYQEENKVPNLNKVSIMTGNSKIYLSEISSIDSGSIQKSINSIYHIPFDISLLDMLRQGHSGENLTQKVLGNVNKNIAKSGFSLVTLHPTDFGKIDPSTKKQVNSVDPFKFQVLVNIIDALEAQGLKITNFSYITPVPSGT